MSLGGDHDGHGPVLGGIDQVTADRLRELRLALVEPDDVLAGANRDSFYLDRNPVVQSVA